MFQPSPLRPALELSTRDSSAPLLAAWWHPAGMQSAWQCQCQVTSQGGSPIWACLRTRCWHANMHDTKDSLRRGASWRVSREQVDTPWAIYCVIHVWKTTESDQSWPVRVCSSGCLFAVHTNLIPPSPRYQMPHKECSRGARPLWLRDSKAHHFTAMGPCSPLRVGAGAPKPG